MVTFREDDYVTELQHDRATAVWVASLDDGTSVYMDDHRPGVEPYSAWLRLAAHLGESGRSIVGLHVKFRSNVQRPLKPHADGYFFCKSAVLTSCLSRAANFYLLGWLTGDKLVVQRWSVPTLILVDHAERDPATAGECLIVNRNTR